VSKYLLPVQNNVPLLSQIVFVKFLPAGHLLIIQYMFSPLFPSKRLTVFTCVYVLPTYSAGAFINSMVEGVVYLLCIGLACFFTVHCISTPQTKPQLRSPNSRGAKLTGLERKGICRRLHFIAKRMLVSGSTVGYTFHHKRMPVSGSILCLFSV